MITSVTLKNFKSYADSTLTLGPLTLLVGANASGKSNALEAIRLLSWLAHGSRLDDIDQEVKNADTLIRGRSEDLFGTVDVPAVLKCHITSSPDGWGYLNMAVKLVNDRLVLCQEDVTAQHESLPLYKIDSDPNPHTDEVSVMYNNFARGANKPHIPCSNRQAIFYQLQTPGRFNEKHGQSQTLIPAVTKSIRNSLQNIVFLDPRPSRMRDYSPISTSRLNEDGSNLASTLYKICAGDAPLAMGGDKDSVLQFVRSLPEQNIIDIEFIKTTRNDVMIRLIESFGGNEKPVDAPLLSDGTLRVLAVAAALLSAPQESLVVIEEIDNGVHPSRAEELISQIRKVATERRLRVLLTSHNPALLNALPPEAIRDVLCCYRDPEHGSSKIIRLQDLQRYPELVAQGPLGQLMTTQVLDKFLKDSVSPEERKRRNLAWVNSLAQGEGEE